MLGITRTTTVPPSAAVAVARCPSRAALPTPACTCSACHAEPARVKGAHVRRGLRQTLARRGPGAADRPQVRRGGDAAGLAIDSRGRRRHTGRRFAVSAPRSSMVAAAPQQWLINGSGCAAASIGGTDWAIPAWAAALPVAPQHVVIAPVGSAGTTCSSGIHGSSIHICPSRLSFTPCLSRPALARGYMGTASRIAIPAPVSIWRASRKPACSSSV